MMFMMFCADRMGGEDDDWAISVALSGIYPDSGLCLFVNGLLSKVTLLLNEIIPSINWFLMIEFIMAFLAFAMFCYAALSFLPLGYALVGITAVEYFFLPYCTYLLNFTFVAAICTLSGFFLIIGCYARNHQSVVLQAIGVILCAFGFMVRSNAFFLALPFMAMALAWIIFRKYRDRDSVTMTECESASVRADVTCDEAPQHRGTRVLRGLAPVGCVIACCVLLFAIDSFMWQDPSWSTWKTLNASRATIQDYVMPPYELVEDRMEQAGVDRSGYNLAIHWATGDTEYFTPEKMAAIASVSEAKSLGSIFSSALEYPLSVSTISKVTVFFAFMIIVFLIFARKGNRLPIVILALLAIVCCSYFYGMGRLLIRVEFPIFLYAFAACLLITGKDIDFFGKRDLASSFEGYGGLLGFLAWGAMSMHLLVVLMASFSLQQAYLQFNQQAFEPKGPIAEFALRDDDLIYVWKTMDYVSFEEIYNHRYIPPADVLDRHISIGGWSSGSPFLIARNDQIGMANIIEGLVRNDRARLVSSESGFAELVLAFIRDHYCPTAEMSIVDVVDYEKEDENIRYMVYDFYDADAIDH